MANQIILKKSSVGGKAPLAGDLQTGEIAINLADKLLYSKDASGTVFNVKADPIYNTGLQDALDAKTNNTAFANHTANTSNPHVVTATQVGLGNVDNESKETMFSSPAFTGTPTAPTAATSVSSTQVATTEFVHQVVEDNDLAIVMSIALG